MIDRITPRGGNDSFRRLDILWPASSTRARRHKPVCPYPVFGHVPATDADRQPLLARKFPEGKPNPRNVASAQKKRARLPYPCTRGHTQSGHPASPSKSRRTSHLAPLASSCSHNRSFRTIASRGYPSFAACPGTHSIVIVCTSETCPSHLYRTRASSNLGTAQQVKRDTYREISGRAPDRRVHFTSCRPAGLHRASRHTKASQRSVTPVRSSLQLCCSQIYTCKRAGNKVRRLMPCSCCNRQICDKRR